MSFVLTYDTLVEKVISYLERDDPTVADDMDAWIKFAHERIGRDSNTQLFEVYVGGTLTSGISVIPKPARWQNTINFNYGSGGQRIPLPNNPIITTNTSSIVSFSIPSTSNLINGQTVIISGALDTGGITASQLNATFPITIISNSIFTCQTSGTASSTIQGGGANVMAFFPTNDSYTPLLLRSYEYARSFWPNQELSSTPKFYADFGYNSWLISPTPDQDYPFQLSYLETPQVIDATYQTNYLTEFMPEVLFKAVLLEAMLALKNDERIGIIESEYVKVLSSWNSKDELRKLDRYMSRKAD